MVYSGDVFLTHTFTVQTYLQSKQNNSTALAHHTADFRQTILPLSLYETQVCDKQSGRKAGLKQVTEQTAFPAEDRKLVTKSSQKINTVIICRHQSLYATFNTNSFKCVNHQLKSKITFI